MILPDFKDFPHSGRVLGIDWGARRVGIAVSDDARQMVFVRPVVDGAKSVDVVVQIVRDDKISGVVIGLPLRTDGSESETTNQVRAFADNLSKITNVPIAFVDETLSSHFAQESMGRVRVRDIKEKLDSESARLILENALALIARQ
ncbi:MAG: Holliday junction resolvase RuvX [Proteobacteria bacterium]|nr:Holliday junction resolvase RuvX [Candidatus Enterousia scatequi]